MASTTTTAIRPAPRKTLLEWIELDDGDTADFTQPGCSRQAQAIHARILLDPHAGKRETPEPLAPPAGLQLTPLG